jgi:hypothetical protein
VRVLGFGHCAAIGQALRGLRVIAPDRFSSAQLTDSVLAAASAFGARRSARPKRI